MSSQLPSASTALAKSFRYHEEALRAGISPSSISSSSVRAAFRPAFRDSARDFPIYGKHHSPPLTPGDWWTQLIEKCMAHAGAGEAELKTAMRTLGPALLDRFESERGYRNFPETLGVRE